MQSKKLIRFDWAMKTILRDKANFDILEGFLSALLEDDDIKVLRLIESESNSEYDTDKFNRVDIMIEDKDKCKIIIEIQNTRETDYLERLLFGTSKVVIENQDLGDDFKNISKVISISILYFNLGTGDDYIYKGDTNFYGMNTGNKLIVKKKKFIDSLETRYKFTEKNIFPEYYLIRVGKYENIVKKRIDEWIYLFKNNEIKSDFKSKNIKNCEKKLDSLNMSQEERKVYEKYLINLARDRDVVNTAINEGLEKGNKEVAINMIKKGVDNDFISDVTGLSVKDIEKLRR